MTTPCLRVLDRHPVVQHRVVALDVLQQVRRLDAVATCTARTRRRRTWRARRRWPAASPGTRRSGCPRRSCSCGARPWWRGPARPRRSRCRSPGTRTSTAPTPGICWRTRKAMASVFESSTTPSSCRLENGWPERLLMSWITPIRSLPDVAAQDRGDHHLLRAVAGALVDRLQEGEVGRVLLELVVVVDVLDVHVALVERAVAGERRLRDRQLDVLERVQPGLHLGDDRASRPR